MAKEDAIEIFLSAVDAVQPANLLQQHIIESNDCFYIGGYQMLKSSINNLYVIGAGKASAAMAVETERILGDFITDGLVTTKYGHALSTQKIQIKEAAHPVPDEQSREAAAETLQLIKKATKNDVIVCLISGGASALWCDVPHSFTLAEVQGLYNSLLLSGASIGEINTVRKHLSYLKGGQLIRYCNSATVISLIISDVPGDDISIIASGITAADNSTFKDAYNVLKKYNLLSQVSPSVLLHFENGIGGMIEETPKRGDAIFNNTINKIIGNNNIALQAAAKRAEALGYDTFILPHVITGEVEEEAEKFVSMALHYTGKKPVCILQGGETTVKVTGKGAGGRNQHFVLACIKMLQKSQTEFTDDITILSGGTDGTDGPTNATGAVADIDTVKEANEKQISIEEFLKNHDSYHFFEEMNGLIITGPTQTNVMDIMMAIIK